MQTLQGLYLLLHRTLTLPADQQHSAATSTSASASTISAALLSAMSQPLLSRVAYSTNIAAAKWPSHLLTLIQATPANTRPVLPQPSTSSSPQAQQVQQAHGHLGMTRACTSLLLQLWSDQQLASSAQHQHQGDSAPETTSYVLRWLAALEADLRRRRADRAAGPASQQLPFSVRMQDVVSELNSPDVETHPAVSALLAALLAHPDAIVRAAAARATRELLLLLPYMSLPLLPLVMALLRRHAAAAPSGRSDGADVHDRAQAQVALLQLLSAMAAVDASVAPYALRVLQPMLMPGAPDGLRCIAMKLLVEAWAHSGAWTWTWSRVYVCVCTRMCTIVYLQRMKWLVSLYYALGTRV